MRILFVSANSKNAYLDIEREQRALQKLVKSGGHSVRLLPGAQLEDVRLALKEDAKHFDVLHFAGHGTKEKGIMLKAADDVGDDPLSGEKLKLMLEGEGIEGLKLVVLNACETQPVVEVIGPGVDAAIGTKRKIEDSAARSFTSNFYGALSEGLTVAAAYEAAKGKRTPYVKYGNKPDSTLPASEISDEGEGVEGQADYYRHFYGNYIREQITAEESAIEWNRYVFYALLGLGFLGAIFILYWNAPRGDIWPTLVAQFDKAIDISSEDAPGFTLSGIWERIQFFDTAAPALIALLQTRFGAYCSKRLAGLRELKEMFDSWDNLPPEEREMVRGVMHSSLKESLTQ